MHKLKFNIEICRMKLQPRMFVYEICKQNIVACNKSLLVNFNFHKYVGIDVCNNT